MKLCRCSSFHNGSRQRGGAARRQLKGASLLIFSPPAIPVQTTFSCIYSCLIVLFLVVLDHIKERGAFRCSMFALMCDFWSTFAFIGRRLVLPCPRQYYRTCATLHVRSAVEVFTCMRMQCMHVDSLLRPRPGYNSSQRPTTRAAVNGVSHGKII